MNMIPQKNRSRARVLAPARSSKEDSDYNDALHKVFGVVTKQIIVVDYSK